MFRFDLVGRRVVSAQFDDGGLGIGFGNEWSIAIFAKSTIHCGDELVNDARQIEGATLTQFIGDSATEMLSFDNGCEIIIDLQSSTDPSGEAMIVYGPDNLIVVWN